MSLVQFQLHHLMPFPFLDIQQAEKDHSNNYNYTSRNQQYYLIDGIQKALRTFEINIRNPGESTKHSINCKVYHLPVQDHLYQICYSYL